MKVPEPVVPLNRYSNFAKLKRVTAWILRFAKNLQSMTKVRSSSLTVLELTAAENYWLSVIQRESFSSDVKELKSGSSISKNSKLLPLRPFWDEDLSLLRVGGTPSCRFHSLIL